jgi:phosphatidylethanolamine/phosphatidyl-N-methylethanolamine N-methyltransferase
LDLDAIRKSYRRYAESYDLYFGAVFQPGRRAVVEQLNCRPGDRILEVGVGTGISLSLYPSEVRIIGIDVSAEMLARAHARKQRERLANVELYEMDAEAMNFADSSFDKVVAMYVASVVPNPQRLVDEMRRVCRPDGELFIVNHFHSNHPLLSRFEKMVAPLSKLVGFRPDFALDQFVHDTHLDVRQRTPVNLMGYWTLLRARNNKATTSFQPLEELPARIAASR